MGRVYGESTSAIRMALPSLVLSLVVVFPAVELEAQSGHGAGVELDIPFVEGGGNEQQLDLYTPSTTAFPTILFVHGGSLVSGDRKDDPYPRMCQTFQAGGIGCATTSYRLAPTHKWPDQPDDVAAAFRWLELNIGARGGDPERIFLLGHSSGCWLIAIVAADARYLDARGSDPGEIAGVMPMGCRLNDWVDVRDEPPPEYETSWVPPDRVDDYMRSEPAFLSLEQRNAAVPSLYVSQHLPPTLVLVAEDERFFPPVLRDGAEFVGRAQSQGAEADLVVLTDRTHRSAIEGMVTADDPAVVTVMEFVRAH